jgi:predicted MFS family arabinose efflux permease
MAGFRYIRGHPEMIALLGVTLSVGFAGDPVNTLSPAYADLFGRSEAFVGLQVAVFGTGSAIGSLVVGWIGRRLDLLRSAKIGMVLLATGLVVTATSASPIIALAGWFVTGIGFVFGITSTNTALQTRLDEDMRGRVMALWGAAFLGSRPMAAMVDGSVADLTSPRIGVVTAAAPLVAGWLLLSWIQRRTRRGEEPSEGHGADAPD